MNKIGIIGVPLQYGQSVAGVELGPKALRDAGLDKVLRKTCEVLDYGDVVVEEELQNEENKKLKNLEIVRSVNLDLFQKVTQSLEDKAFALVVGGDHALGIGSVAAVSNKIDNLGLIWFDAHTDINTEETTPSGNIHGMSLACLLGYGHKDLVDLVPVKIKPENIVVIGARSVDPGEKEIIERLNIKVYSTEDIRLRGMKQVITEVLHYLKDRTKAIHLSFDLDSLDPGVCPGVGVPEENGLSLEEVEIAMKHLGSSGVLESMDLVELNPKMDQGGVTTQIALDVVGWLLDGFQNKD